MGVLAFIMFSCEDGAESLRKMGRVTLELQSHFVNEIEVDKEKDIDVSEFSVNFLQGEEVVKSYESFASMPSEVLLEEGEYVVEAYSGLERNASFDDPFYSGKEAVSILSNQTTSVKVLCQQANVKVSVSYTDEFKAYYDHYETEVSNAEGLLVFEKEEQRSGFFNVGALTIRLKELDDQGQLTKILALKEIVDVHAQDHFRITFDVQNKDGQSSILLVVDETTRDIGLEFTIPMDWISLEEPSFELTGFEEANELRLVEGFGSEVAFDVKAEGALISLKLNVHSDKLINQGWEKTYELADLTPAQRSFLESKGVISSPSIWEESTASVDFSLLTENLGAQGESSSLYEFDLEATDFFERKVCSPKLSITIDPALYELNDIHEGDVWAKHLIVNGTMEKGNREKLVVEAKHGVVWTQVESVFEWQDNSFIANVRDLTPGTNYQIRLKYLEKHTTEYGVTTESAIQLPNSDMESWSEEVVAPGGSFVFVPYDPVSKWYAGSDQNGSWETVNEKTTEHRGRFTYNYNSLSGTKPSLDAKQGKYSAEIATVGYGNGNTHVGGSGSIVYKRAAGKLFLGEYQYDPEEYELGIPYASRPSALRFWTKYLPFEDDQAYVYIKLENRNNGEITEIAKGEWVSGIRQDVFQQIEIKLDYSKRDIKATHMLVMCQSSKDENDLKTYSKSANEITGEDRKHEGSVLYVDDFELIF
ncbi:hypothetical protein HNQ88_002485 [Aureibacter tunicatorum]|uniref:Carbohydrate metabolism domain-containing protein n=2 Tax=Aureibacter tunicatorum TaxID=866807 RepID=A0AAE3XMR9_9BACT|nr:hypothetical protein [Aureibacter tunicatorum]BDD04629.1 hypothetical protein AUTU_21120 [Aureibacter tunicatorum]